MVCTPRPHRPGAAGVWLGSLSSPPLIQPPGPSCCPASFVSGEVGHQGLQELGMTRTLLWAQADAPGAAFKGKLERGEVWLPASQGGLAEGSQVGRTPWGRSYGALARLPPQFAAGVNRHPHQHSGSLKAQGPGSAYRCTTRRAASQH